MPRGIPGGSIFQLAAKRFAARIRYTDSQGRPREKKRICSTRSEARSVLNEMTREIERELASDSQLNPDRKFTDLVTYFRKHYLHPPEYVGDRKVAGMRSWKRGEFLVNTLEKHFGAMKIGAIRYDSLKAFRSLRLRTPIVSKSGSRPRAIASVNREMAMLRRILNIAVTNGWITRNPFSQGDSLISAADEKKRMRVLSRAEASRLLDQCAGPRSHLRTFVLAALDTGLRQGELLGVRWEHIDWSEGSIQVPARNTKTMVARIVPLTRRLAEALASMREVSAAAEQIVFPLGSVKRSFATACRLAKLDGVRFHDLRHTAITWMVEAGMPHARIMAISGHSQISTFLRYVNVDNAIAREAARALDEFHSESVQTIDNDLVN